MVFRRKNMGNIWKAYLEQWKINFIKDRTALYFKPLFTLKYFIQDLVNKIMSKK